MPTLPTMQVVIAIAAVIAAVVSFGLYFAITVNWLKPGAQKASEDALLNAREAAKGLVGPSAADVAEMLKSLVSLTEGLVKAGPALWLLVGSALFLIIAAVAAGLFSSAPGPGAADGGGAPKVVHDQKAGDLPADENVTVK